MIIAADVAPSSKTRAMRGRAVLAAALAALATTAAAPACVADCDCAMPRDLETAAAAADVVFAATSLGFRIVGEDTVRFRAPFHVHAVYKGDVPADAVVWSEMTDCAYAFVRDDAYLVFARRDAGGRLVTAQCTGTRHLDEVGDGLDALGNPRDPSPPTGTDAGAP